MKTVLIVVCLLLALSLLWFFIQGYMSRSAVATGLINGHLSACPDKPNCVSSESAADAESFVTPIQLTANNSIQTWKLLKETLVEQGGRLQVENEDYLAAIFVSSVFGFVDDLEIRFDAQQNLFHIRSASRVGHSDFGINRKRVERLKKRLREKSSDLRLSNYP